MKQPPTTKQMLEQNLRRADNRLSELLKKYTALQAEGGNVCRNHILEQAFFEYGLALGRWEQFLITKGEE